MASHDKESARVQECLQQLSFTDTTLINIHHDILRQLQKGLEMHKRSPTQWLRERSDFMMLDACVSRMPTGREIGTYYALDVGGTHMRIIRAVFNGTPDFEAIEMTEPLAGVGVTPALPKGIFDAKATASMLFRAIAARVKHFMQENGDLPMEEHFHAKRIEDGLECPQRTQGSAHSGHSPSHLEVPHTPPPQTVGCATPASSTRVSDQGGCSGSRSYNDEETKPFFDVGFTFSFGLEQRRINSAIVRRWSKNIETGIDSEDPVIGRDVVVLMNHALEAERVPARITCVTNDTIGTLLTGAVGQPRSVPPCTVGLICGTGFNACYVEPDAVDYGYTGRIVNVEAGGFSSSEHIPTCIADVELDFTSTNRGFQLLEKKIAGFSLPELLRLSMIQVFRSRAPELCWEPGSLQCSDMAEIFKTSEDDLHTVRSIVMKAFAWHHCTDHDLKIVKMLTDAFWKRSAALTAAVATALARKTKHLTKGMGGVTVAVDGSVYVKNPRYRELVEFYCRQILGECADQLKMVVTFDGSGRGAACLAAVQGGKELASNFMELV